MVFCSQVAKMMMLTLFKACSRSNVETLIFCVHYAIYARAIRYSPILKIRPPVVLILDQFMGNMKNNFRNWLEGQSFKIECTLNGFLRYTIHAEETTFLSSSPGCSVLQHWYSIAGSHHVYLPHQYTIQMYKCQQFKHCNTRKLHTIFNVYLGNT